MLIIMFLTKEELNVNFEVHAFTNRKQKTKNKNDY
jgi:hypothetical protein